jgi:lysozyme
MQASASIIAYIAQQEGFVAHPYLDPPHNTKGLYSIGYGHQIQPGEAYFNNSTLTTVQAMALLNKDVAIRVNAVNSMLTRPVTQSQFDAFVDFAYNEGTGAAAKVVATWNATGDSTATAAHLLEYDISSGSINPNLVVRRAHEASLFGADMISTIQKKTSPGTS